jgi:predicted dehydrogenase
MSEPLEVALVGYGMAGKVFHAPLIAATSGLALTTVISSDPAKVHADWPDAVVVADLRTALAERPIDLVVIASPDHFHADHAVAALEAGKPVVVDKPVATTLDQARRIAALGTERGLLVSVFHNRRWDADYLTVRKLIGSGRLGRIVQFESHFDRYRPQILDRWKDRRDGGIWQDLGPHLVDQALHLFGTPQAVFADLAIQRPGAAAPDYAHVLLRYPDLRVILHASQSTQASGLRFAIHGTAGSYIKHGTDPQEGQAAAGLMPDAPGWGIDPIAGELTAVDADGVARTETAATERGDYPSYYAGVRDAILGVGANPVGPDAALAAMTIFEAGLASVRERREIAV